MMLAEFLLTPATFDVDDVQLRSRLFELRQLFFPRQGVSTFVACQLGGLDWQKAVTRKIARIRNHELREEAQLFFHKLVEDASVIRPSSLTDVESCEKSWIEAGKRSAAMFAFDGIVANGVTNDSENIFSFDQFVSDSVFERFKNPRFVSRSEDFQAPALRAICLHSDWLIVRLPQIKGGNDDEIVTLKQILGLASSRVKIKSPCTVEVHIASRLTEPSCSNVRNSIFKELEGVNNGECDLSIRMVPKFLDRMIFGGEWAQVSGGKKRRRLRWMITMSHVAIHARREACSDECTWALHDRKSANEYFEKHVGKLDEY
jgi:hypothetical protein